MGMHQGGRLRALLGSEGIVVCPGAQDCIAARVIEMSGFDVVYMTGHGTSLSVTGYPDAGLMTMTEVARHARNMAGSVDVPVVADADEGFGNAVNVVRTVREFATTGVAAIQLEDQVAPKRCGHVAGRRIVSEEEAVGKYRAAADVRDERAPEMLIIARTDALGAVGGSLELAIDRANAYCEAGADIAFIESPESVDHLERLAEEVHAPLLYNSAGLSPRLDPAELEQIGFKVMIYPGAGMRSAIAGMFEHLLAFKERGIVVQSEMDETFDALPFETDLESELRKFFEFGGFPEIYEWEERYLPAADREKYEGTLGENLAR